MGLLHRVWGTNALHDANTNLRTAITAELVSGMPAQYGREYIWRHLSIRGIPVARDRMFAIMKELDPEAVAARKSAFKAGCDRVGKYLVPGRSVDGHFKFRDYGIGIYACIDGYSRYITSIHVGLSVTCAVSILKQYLDALSGNDNIRPTIIRAQRPCLWQMPSGSLNKPTKQRHCLVPHSDTVYQSPIAVSRGGGMS